MSLMIKICMTIATLLIIFTYILNKKSYDFEKLSQYEYLCNCRVDYYCIQSSTLCCDIAEENNSKDNNAKLYYIVNNRNKLFTDNND